MSATEASLQLVVKQWQQYPEYKDTEEVWIGKIPSHWKMERLGSLVKSPVVPNQGKYSNFIALENIESGTGVLIKGEEQSQTIGQDGVAFRKGDVLFGKLRPYLHKYWLADYDGICSGELLVFRPLSEKITAEFLYNLVQTDYFVSKADSTSYGVKMPRTSWDILKTVRLPLPPVDEQRRISVFIKNRIEKVNTLIGRKQHLIELLQEKRTALISHAVTKGLDPSVPMKDSGIEWIGKIPAHWEVNRLKQKWIVTDCKHRTAEYVEDGIPIVSTTEVKPGRLNLSNTRMTTEKDYSDLTEGRLPKKGDIIYSRNASLGSAAYVDTNERFCMGQDVCLITSKDKNQLFLSYLLNSPIVTGQIESEMVGSTINRVNVDQIKNYWVTCPPLNEQNLIAEYLDKISLDIDQLINKVNNGIELLKEYRTSLISYAVTGKIDVRGEAQ